MSHGKGSIPMRKIDHILKENNYTFVRYNGHYIWKGKEGNTVAIPKTCCTPLIRRIFKENNIKM
ncbi:hypothetical protein SAMN04490370_12526 [Eubacterium ruminantium]|uniref:HicA toxin of toxin-antitoxin n=1 Tax=Eubacterium ruminantium TaxID=42322 RepID=A0A1T4QQS5_9FIRM|nr:hypothetical protein SAMN04490370_12526 [Eubacterium ruminantium]SKA06090.1 hypothetical protein SAMN02745110_02479 [Eubacterium ruminantium]